MRLKQILIAFVLPCMLLLASLMAMAQDSRVITGKITDAKTGAPLVGVSVSELSKDGQRGVTTNTDGAFRIVVSAGVKSLVITSVGYTKQEVSIDGITTLTVQLQASAAELGEVVLVGYGSVKKKEVTGSISTVSSKDFQKGAITTPEQLISGKVAGVSITPNGGAPGAGSTIRIRGGASLNASNDPLIVVDGVPLSNNTISGASNPLSLLNPNDFESFTVLKDASATAIYGSRASNGVILITTKKGKSGKPTVNFNSQFSVSHRTKLLPVLSAAQVRAYVDSFGTAAQQALLGTANTNWQDEIYQNGIATNNNISVAGSFKGMPYRVSLGYLDQTGILMTDKLQRTSASITLSPRFFDNHLKVDINLKGAHTDTRFANQSAIGAAASFDPTQPVYDSASKFGGYFEWTQGNDSTPNPNATRNPVALLKQKMDKSTVDRSFGNVQLDYKFHFLPDLHANLNLGYDVSKGMGNTYIPADAAQGSSTKGSNNDYKQTVSNSVAEFYLNYVKDLKSIKSNINVTAGYGYYDYLTTTYNYAQFSAKGDTIAGTTQVYPYDKPRNTLLSYYGRLVYTYNDKYTLAASIRTDGSSKFAKANRWGTFPSAAFTWRINQEDFMRDNGIFSDLKLRLSYGITGQQDGISNYSYLATYGLGVTSAQYQFGNTYYYTYSPSAYVANLKWEQTATSNIGLDYGFLHNRITGSVDFYYKKTKDLLSTVPVPAGSNFSNQVTTNIGNITSKGIEFSINATAIRSNNFNWDLGFNFAYNAVKITNLLAVQDSSFVGNLVGGISGGTGQTVQVHSVGYTPYSFYVYKQLYGQDGKPIEGAYADLNHDGSITSSDLYRYKSPNPKFVIGFSTQASYKKWTLSTVLRANIGNYVYNNVNSNYGVQKNVISPSGYIGNATTDIYSTGFYSNQYLSDYYVENASFLRMDNLGLSYNVGKIINDKATLHLSANCQNVFVVTKYKGLDPEISSGIDNNFYPRPRTYTLGVNLDF